MPPSVVVRRLPELVAGFARGAPDVAVNDLAIDSREVRPGSLFLACRGTRQHGLDFLPQALANGAAALLWEPTRSVGSPGVAPPAVAIPSLSVEGLSRRVGEIAARFFGHPSRALHAVGVTGTDGKTSTAWLIAQALEALGEPCLYVGTLGSGRIGALMPGDHTTPDPVNLQRVLHAAREDGARAVAMEVSSHALDQARVAGVEFHTAVLTNVGRDHLDYHGTLERYADAKKKLFTELRPKALALNRDDARGAAWARELAAGGARLTIYGLDGDAPGGRHVIGRSLNLRASGIAFEATTHEGRARIDSRLLGRFNAYNLLAALSALLEKGVPLAPAAEALSGAPTVPGRIEGFRGRGAAPLVVVDYAHTPQALSQVLHAVRAHCRATLWCVFGCGGDRDRGKRPLMAAAAAQAADRVIVTDDNPRSEDPAAIVREIQAGFPKGFSAPVLHDRATAIETAVRQAGPDDVVVVAGKGHEDYQIYGQERRSFSDRDFAARLTRERPPEGEARGQS
ncbi:MAG: UDP-N-acetylmuramoyl-L-alanyl-D-glutamate--2,6-diaminopimelate ligase [Nevskiaceae bacterium]